MSPGAVPQPAVLVGPAVNLRVRPTTAVPLARRIPIVRPGTPFCVLGNCAACETSTNCDTGQVCQPATHQCQAPCTTNAECTGVNGTTATCDTTAGSATLGACIGCTTATAATVCPATRPVCDTNRMQCSQCASRANCGTATPACNMQTGNCVECLVDTDCNGQGACGTDHACHPYCHANTDCATTPARPICDTASGICGQCVTSTDCATNATGLRICNTTTLTCVGCSANTDCAATPTTPICQTRTNTCVACAANTDCPAATPICRAAGGGAGAAAACVQCEINANCTTAALPRCDVQTGLCVQCATNADCAATPTTPTCTNGACAA